MRENVPLRQADRPFIAFEEDEKLYQTRLPFGVKNGVSCFQRIIEKIGKYELKGTFAYLDHITVSGFDKTDRDTKLDVLLSVAKAECLTFNEINMFLLECN